MKTNRVVYICLALILATAASGAAQQTGHISWDENHGEQHGALGFLEEIQQGDYSETELAAIHDYLQTIHESIEEIMGLHDHEGPAPDAEELHEAGEVAFLTFLDAYENVVLELEAEHARAFTGMLFQHLLHAGASHAHGVDGEAHAAGPHGHV